MALTNTGNFEKNNQKLQYQFTSQSDNARLDSLEDSLRDVRESLKSLVDKKDIINPLKHTKLNAAVTNVGRTESRVPNRSCVIIATRRDI